jgi:hypothetical protein
MGALTSVGPYIPFIKESLNTITGTARREATYADQAKEQQLALKQLQATQRLQARQAEQNAALERERMTADAAAAENSRLTTLRRAVARQRANFGAQGTGSDGGSAGAVLLGLFDESEDELAQRERMDDIRRRALDLGAAQRGALNTLQYSQLQERQKLGRLSETVDRAGGFAGTGLDLADTIYRASGKGQLRH